MFYVSSFMLFKARIDAERETRNAEPKIALRSSAVICFVSFVPHFVRYVIRPSAVICFASTDCSTYRKRAL